MKRLVVLFTLLIAPFWLLAQETFPTNGVKEKDVLYHAFTNATIVNYKDTLKKVTLLIRKGKIEQVGNNVSLPKGCVVHDLEGKYIYPSFIDPYSTYGIPKLEKKKYDGPQFISDKKGPYSWNEALKPEVNAAELFTPDDKTAKELRKIGFGAVSALQNDGIARGTSALVLLGGGNENELIIKGNSAAHYSFRKGVSKQDYPSSLMGAIALLRQAYLDADWYAKNTKKKEVNLSIEAWNRNQSIPQIFEVKDFLEVLRADKVGDEFNVQYIIKGGGDEYKRVEEIKATNAALIVPLAFPKPFDITGPYEALYIDLADMKHWELAPGNAFFLNKENVPFAFTTDGLELKSFFKNLQKAIKYGLPQEEALKALTLSPAKILGVDNEIGSIKAGMRANFIITSKPVFDEKCTIHENWIDGKPYFINDINRPNLSGKYDLTIAKKVYELQITDEAEEIKAKIVVTGEDKLKVTISVTRQNVSLSFAPDTTIKSSILLSGLIDGKSMSGKGQLTDGTWTNWKATYKGELENGEKPDSAKTEQATEEISVGEIWYPFSPYGSSKQLKIEDVLIQNATVWTNEKEGILENTDVLIIGGKIEAVGKGLTPPKKGNVIDAKGKHVTSGIIDEHSHIAISKGVNESGQSSSAEVSISDVVNSEDVNLYRQLAGGVVAAQLLHGSANPIGGQSGLIKFRWGKSPEEMKIKGADGFIKFALGENVKQSNWGDDQTKRFPQTRMGVEQVFYDHFVQAKEYKAEQASISDKMLNYPRKDLEMDALVEILDKKRFITCHSYVQSEINMLMHVGDSMGFTINTFTHILEGYKVADKMKEHSAGGSTFSDWWAYKFEVNDAIPYNAAMLNKAGVVTAINSDDAEMGRRLNQEAAKAVKYGGASEEDAWKMVTLNPAKLLHLDNRMGSIKKGKDADVVIWSDNPLSVYAKAEKTYVDGVCYFDIERDKQLREEVKNERNRLIQKMIKAKEAGEETQKPEKKEEKLYHCDTMLDEY